ncbi:MAG: hypothetical protein GXP30_08435 [Verrucomicrobia bacterium]|nr:hypothetical protein [Verrucomicrobiota bacterium]
MRNLNNREIKLLLLCLFTIFAMGNLFAVRAIYKGLKGGKGRVSELKLEILEQQGWLGDKDYWERKNQWLVEKMPPGFDSAGKAQGELVQFLQDSLYESRIKIDRQTLLEPKSSTYYDEVAVNLRIQGDAMKVNEWLSKLQGVDRFQTLQTLKLSIDSKSKLKEPQAICEVTVARWFRRKG